MARSDKAPARPSEGARLKNSGELEGAAKPLRTGSPGLIEAILRISASLDVTTVLRDVVESARALTAARYGAIVTVGDSGQVQEFFTSGVEPDVHSRLEQWPDGPRLFEHFRNLPGAHCCWMTFRSMPGHSASPPR